MKMENIIAAKMGNITQKWVEILVPFCSDYSAKLTASDISRSTKISQQTASRVLNKLAEFNLVRYNVAGKNKEFYLELDNPNSELLLGIAEHKRTLDFILNCKKQGIIINKILRFCEGIILFGSYASGRYKKNSDLDLVVLGKSSKKEIDALRELSPMDINIYYFGFEEFKSLSKKKEPLFLEICKNHILFGDFFKVVKLFSGGESGRY